MKYFLDVHYSIYTRSYVPSGKEYLTYYDIYVSCHEEGDIMKVKARKDDMITEFDLEFGQVVKAFGCVNFGLRDANDPENIEWFKASTVDSNVLADYYEILEPGIDTSSIRSADLAACLSPHSHMDPDIKSEYEKGKDDEDE